MAQDVDIFSQQGSGAQYPRHTVQGRHRGQGQEFVHGGRPCAGAVRRVCAPPASCQPPGVLGQYIEPTHDIGSMHSVVSLDLTSNTRWGHQQRILGQYIAIVSHISVYMRQFRCTVSSSIQIPYNHVHVPQNVPHPEYAVGALTTKDTRSV